jgi:hypothetical protein
VPGGSEQAEVLLFLSEPLEGIAVCCCHSVVFRALQQPQDRSVDLAQHGDGGIEPSGIVPTSAAARPNIFTNNVSYPFLLLVYFFSVFTFSYLIL